MEENGKINVECYIRFRLELGLCGKILVVGGCRGDLCEQNTALHHIRSEPAPAAPKEHSTGQS